MTQFSLRSNEVYDLLVGLNMRRKMSSEFWKITAFEVKVHDFSKETFDYYTNPCNSSYRTESDMRMKTETRCATGPALSARALLSPNQGAELGGLFKLLANETRLRLLHALEREEDMCVGDLADALGMKPQAVSNQLQRLTNRGIVEPTRNGLRIHYRIVDPCTIAVLDHAWCLLECASAEIKAREELEVGV